MQPADAILIAAAVVAVCSTAAFLAGFHLQRSHAERAVWQDHRVAELRKCALVARIRSCPVEWVVEERDALRSADGEEA